MAVHTFPRNHSYGLTVKMVVWSCPSCGIVYGIPKDFADDCRRNGTCYYCPNGHSLGWDESDADRERARAEAAEQAAAAAEHRASTALALADQAVADAAAQRRSAAALRGHLTRMRRRIAHGVCPVPGCKRSGFEKVMAHVAAKHADWLAAHPEICEPSS